MKLLIVIPALNEEASISQVINEVKRYLPYGTVLVVDDGSQDDTATVASQSGAVVIKIPFNIGVGGAIKTGFRYALDKGFNYVLQIDADGQHLASEARHLLEKISDNAIVVGSRFLNKNINYEVGIARRSAMRILAIITGRICHTRLTDVTSGFRLTSGKAIKIFSQEYPREYLGDTVESLIIAHRYGIKISEVPVIMKPRIFGNPSQNLIKSFWYLSRALLVIALTILRKSSDR